MEPRGGSQTTAARGARPVRHPRVTPNAPAPRTVRRRNPWAGALGANVLQRQQRQAAAREQRAANRLGSALPAGFGSLPYQHQARVVASLISRRGYERKGGAAIPFSQLVSDSNARERKLLQGFVRRAQEGQAMLDARSLSRHGFLPRTQPETANKYVYGRKAYKPDTKVGPFGLINVSALGREFNDVTAIAPNLRILKAVPDTIGAAIEDPFGVGFKTLKGAGELAIGAPAALGELGARIVTEGPGKALGDLGKQVSADFTRRYGPLIEGNDRAFIDRIKKEGAAPEIFDVATVTGGTGALVGRAASRLARSGALGSRAHRFVTEPRPRLRVAGNKAVEQSSAPNVFRLALQRRQDRTRANRLRRRNEKAPNAKRGLQPRPGNSPSGRPVEVVKGTLRSQARRQRVEASGTQSMSHTALKNEQAAEIDARGGAQHAAAKLNRHEQRAMFHAGQGLTTLDPKTATHFLKQRRDQILAERPAGTTVPEQIAKHADELRVIDDLLKHPEKSFTPKLARWQAGEVARAKRLEPRDPAVLPTTAEARRLAPQAHVLGVEHPYAAAREQIVQRAREVNTRARKLPEPQRTAALKQIRKDMKKAVQTLDRAKPELDRRFIQAVHTKARALGLPEPIYWRHTRREQVVLSDRTVGAGAAAVQGVHKSELKLFRAGVADTHPSTYVGGVARSIKRRHQWALVDKQFATHAVPLPMPSELKRILDPGGKRKGKKAPGADNLSIEDLRRVLEHKGLDPRDYAFYNPKRLRSSRLKGDHSHEPLQVKPGDEATANAERQAADRQDRREARDQPDQPSKDLHKAFNESAFPADDVPAAYAKGTGWQILPRAAYDEIHASTHPSGLGGRAVSKVQGFQSTVILGTNPSWAMIQPAANAFVAGFATRGNPKSYLFGPRWFSKLPPDVKEQAVQLFGHGLAERHRPHLGSTLDNGIVNGWRAFRETQLFRSMLGSGQGAALGSVAGLAAGHPLIGAAVGAAVGAAKNPLDTLFRFDERQNQYFKKVVLHSLANRQAYQQMGRDFGGMARAAEELQGIFKASPSKAVVKLLHDPGKLEALAKTTDDFLGNYTRFTHRERAYMKRGVLFYGFMRYAVRTLLYTLPVKHPLAASISAQLANLHNNEVRDLLGGPDTPWAYSRIFFGKRGDLRSIDLLRLNPVTTPVTEAAQSGPQALSGFMSPLIQEVVGQIAGENLFTGQKYRLGGSAERGAKFDAGQWGPRARVALRNLLRSAYPYRAWDDFLSGGASQSDDSLLGDTPVKYKTAAAQTLEQVRRKQKGDPRANVLSSLVPFVPKQDPILSVAQGIRARAKKNPRGTVPAPRGGGGAGTYDWNTAVPSGAGGTYDWSTAKP